MPNCSVLRCSNRTIKQTKTQSNITYHRFPKDPSIRQIWVKATARSAEWIPTIYSAICSIHFAPSVFIKSKNGIRTYLKKDATPTQHLPFHVKTDENLPPSSFLSTETLNTNASQDVVNEDNHITNTFIEETGPNLIPEEHDTPRQIILKRHIRQLEFKDAEKKKKIKRLQYSNRKLIKKIANLETILKTLSQNPPKIKDENYVLRNISEISAEIAKRELSQSGSSTKIKARYSPSLKAFAMTLHYYSPKAYSYVRKVFNTSLPAITTIRNWYKSIDALPGFTLEALTAIKERNAKAEKKIYCGIIFDEMNIREKIEYVPNENRHYGYVNMGAAIDNDCTDAAKEALVFMVVAINASWKVPIGYFLTNGVSGEQKALLVKNALNLLKETGVEVVSLTFDGHKSNIAMCEILGCSFDSDNLKTSFTYEDYTISVFLDPCHLIKLVRNAFEAYRELKDLDGNSVSWNLIEQLHFIQEKEGFHLCNKFTKENINFKNKIMRVKLATQLFNRSVALALSYCCNDLKSPNFLEAEGTINFVKAVNDLFDILNSRVRGKGLKGPVFKENKHKVLDILNNLSMYLKQLTVVMSTKKYGVTAVPVIKSFRKTGFLGFCVSAESAKAMLNRLIGNEKDGLEYIPFHKISQDHIELLFCNFRAHGGAMNDPTARLLRSFYKKVLVHTQLTDSGTGNCIAIDDISMLNCSSAANKINFNASRRINNTVGNEDDFVINDVCPNENVSEFTKDGIEYIAGFIVHRLIKLLKCDTCAGALILFAPKHKNLISKRSINDELIHPSQDVVKICELSEIVIRKAIAESGGKKIKQKFTTPYLVAKIMKTLIGKTFFQEIDFHQYDTDPLNNHIIDLCKAIMQIYINTRLTHLTKSFSSKLSQR